MTHLLSSPARIALLFACGFLICTSALAQETADRDAGERGVDERGSIIGVVVDSETGETLPGANVVVEGTSVGTTTDLDGRYTLEVAPGTYDLVFSYIGYNNTTVQDVEVDAGEPTRIEMQLTSEAIGLDEVVVEARAVQNSEAALLGERQKSTAMKDAISAEAMSQSGSGDAAEAMSKVTGASVVAGRYVYVRGLGGRYSTAQLNGASLPSADPDQNSAQLDLFPTNLLDNIVATKTFTPDQPGNFSGGSVNITTKDFPDSFTLKATASTAYNSAISLSDEFLTGPSSDTDWLGFDDGMRAVPDMLEGDVTIPRTTQATRDAELAQQIEAFSESFNDVLVPAPGEAGLNQSYSFSVGNQLPLFGRPFGFVASATYNRDYSGYAAGTTAQFEATDPAATSLNQNFDLADTRGTQQSSWGLISNLSYELHPFHQIGFNVLRTQDGESLGRYQVGPYPKNLAETVRYETYVLQYTERSVTSFQTRGEHYLKALSDLRVDWNAAYTDTEQEEPDLRFFFDQFVDITRGDSTIRLRDINTGSSNATLPSRIFRNLQEDNREGNLNVELPMTVGLSAPVRFKAGGSYLRKERAFGERKFDYRDNSLDFSDFGGDIGAYFSDENVGILSEEGGRFTFGNTIQEGSVAANNYDGSQEVAAGYAMVEVPLLQRLRVIGGARYETTDIEIVSEDPSAEVGRISTGDVLPSLNLIYALQDNMNLRLSGSRTLARPTFREIAPFTSFSFAGGPTEFGNPNLNRTLITNLDARWEWFAQPGEILAVSGFYKHFQDPIERVVVSNNNQITYNNVDQATVLGAEFEVRDRLGWIAPPLNALVANANFALIYSEVDVPERELEFAQGFDIDPTRAFQGQSPYVLNLGLAYENPSSGTLASLSYNRFGERLTAVSLGGAPNIFEQPRNDLFASIGQRVFGTVELKFSVDNLLGASYIESQEYEGQAYVTREYEIGRTYKLSVSYDL